ncbi:hypothetical protein IWW55_003001 [Coemansia sp. RSA 2706]|nr:hypothetical protein IWW55_003001 [Coemansia sp. RSA 2706]
MQIKPLLKTAKQLGYQCVQINRAQLTPLAKQHHIKSQSGIIVYHNGHYTSHVEKIDNSVFHTNETQKPDDVDGYQYEALPVYPPMKPDEPGPLYMQKPDEPDMIQETHGGFGAHMAVPEHQKPNEVEDMNSDEFRRRIYYKALPPMPGQHNAGVSDTPQQQTQASNKPAEPPVNQCACVIL